MRSPLLVSQWSYWKSKRKKLAAILLTSLAAHLRPQTAVVSHNNQLYQVQRFEGAYSNSSCIDSSAIGRQQISRRQRRANSTSRTLATLPPYVERFYRHHYVTKNGGKRMAKLPKCLQPGDIQLCLVKLPAAEDDPEEPRRRMDENVDHSPMMVAGVRLFPTSTQPLHNDPHWYFLRGLCVATSHQHQGLASRLLQHVLETETATNHSGVYLFADPSLAPLYVRNGLDHMQSDANGSSTSCLLPQRIVQGYHAIQNRRTRTGQPPVALFVRQPPLHRTAPSSTTILLLQHAKEHNRKTTATGQLLLPPTKDEECQGELQVHLLSWAGRADNERVERALRQHLPTLLWTGGQVMHAGTGSHRKPEVELPSNFVVLDGTWQEARSMFRKIPLLQSLPRWTLQPVQPSKYRLRGDYTQWRQRFATTTAAGSSTATATTPTLPGSTTSDPASSSRHLLCTAEVVAHLLQQLGHDHRADTILQRLEAFQDTMDPPSTKRAPP